MKTETLTELAKRANWHLDSAARALIATKPLYCGHRARVLKKGATPRILATAAALAAIREKQFEAGFVRTGPRSILP